MSDSPESVPVSAAEFDALMERAGLRIKPEWRRQMLVEYGQLRMNMNVIHQLANTCHETLNIWQPITFGRTEE